MKQKEFDKIAMEAKGYREHIERIANSGIKQYALIDSNGEVHLNLKEYCLDNFGIDLGCLIKITKKSQSAYIKVLDAWQNVVSTNVIIGVFESEQELTPQMLSDHYSAKLELAEAVDSLLSVLEPVTYSK